ncbi:MAG TPA: hypothetical protein VH350_14435 [Candidatus Sulfotelmatobacter sp.]|jgi:hypothetical protein|nr:hypothetical protein [Candidatus Sulfotelmatobacter sp.]
MRQASPNSTRRITIATLVFIVCCLLSTVRILSEAPSPTQSRSDAVDLSSDQRFAALKLALPQYGIVGYIGDSVSPADYYFTQYALAPLIVDHSSNHPLVVGNFSVSQPPNMPPDHLRLVKDFGNGVQLFANKDAQ